MSYDIHPSEELQAIFKKRPYQGASPDKARLLVVGTDANYSPEISGHFFFEQIIDYHHDGVGFWRKNGVHHPFLLPDYPFDRRKGGVKYHREFAKLGLGPAHADAVSFVELLDVPTIGVTGKDKGRFYELLSAEHLSQLERLILEGNRKLVLINQTLVNSIRTINKKVGVMHRLANIIRSAPTATLIYESEQVSIYNGYSFSHNNTNEYLADLGKLIRTYFLGE